MITKQTIQFLQDLGFKKFDDFDWDCWAGCDLINGQEQPLILQADKFTFILDGNGFTVNFVPNIETLEYYDTYDVDFLSVFADYECDILQNDWGFLITGLTNQKIEKIFPFIF